jgi:type II secretory ATPase GspE/PulE/Tfp pilus assembly ATPase PilB-like protein
VAPELIEQVKQELKKVPLYMLQERLKGVKTLEDINETYFYEGVGCVQCQNIGYRGRVAILEVIDVNDKVQEMIMDTKKIMRDDDIRENQEYITMKEDGIIKALQGLITLQEVYRVIQD